MYKSKLWGLKRSAPNEQIRDLPLLEAGDDTPQKSLRTPSIYNLPMVNTTLTANTVISGYFEDYYILIHGFR